MLASGFHRDAPPVAILTIDDEHALQLRLIDELHAIRHGEEPHASRRLTPDVRIVEAATLPPVLIERARPILERHLVERQIAGQSAWGDRTSSHHVPETLDSRNLAQIHAPIRPARGRLRRSRRRGAAAATPAPSGSAAALITGGTRTPGACSTLTACPGSLRAKRIAQQRRGKNGDDQTPAEQFFSHRRVLLL